MMELIRSILIILFIFCIIESKSQFPPSNQEYSFDGIGNSLATTEFGEFIFLHNEVSNNYVDLSQKCEEKIISIFFFPNPTNNDVRVYLTPNLGNLCGEIYNLQGMCVKKLECIENEALIDISNLHPGTYYVLIKNSNNYSINKIVKI